MVSSFKTANQRPGLQCQRLLLVEAMTIVNELIDFKLNLYQDFIVSGFVHQQIAPFPDFPVTVLQHTATTDHLQYGWLCSYVHGNWESWEMDWLISLNSQNTRVNGSRAIMPCTYQLERLHYVHHLSLISF